MLGAFWELMQGQGQFGSIVADSCGGHVRIQADLVAFVAGVLGALQRKCGIEICGGSKVDKFAAPTSSGMPRRYRWSGSLISTYSSIR